MDLSNLVPFLKSQNVSTFEGYGVKLSFFETKDTRSFYVSEAQSASSPSEKIEKPKSDSPTPQQAADIPQSIDNELTFDQIRDWSASPDPSAPAIPMTGDQQLDPEAGKA